MLDINKHVAKISKCLKYNKHLAEDIVQDAYLKALERSELFDPSRGTYEKWFNSILYSCLRDAQRKNSKQGLSDFDIENIPEEVFEEINVISDEIEETINPNHKEILTLVYLKGYNSKEVSRLLGTTVTNVTTICSRFREKVRENYGSSI